MAAATQQYVIPVITNSRRRKNQRFTMSANCLNKNYKLNRRNLIKIQVTQKFQNTSAGIISNIPNCLGEKMKSLPNVMVVNARSVYNKLNELEILVDNNNSDIVFLTETWLTDNIPDEAINCLGMNLVRLDRKHGTGGGVALLINSKIPFKVRDDLSCSLFECIWITVRPKWLPREISRISVCCVYLPPGQSEMDHFYDYLYQCYDKLCSESPNSAFIIAGDFNPMSTGFQSRRLKIHCNLKQVVKEPTRKNNILDLIFTNIAKFYVCPDTLAPLSSSDHNIVIWKSKKTSQGTNKGKTVKVKVREIKQTNTNRFGFFLENFDWNQVLWEEGVDKKGQTFLECTNSMINQFFPEKTIRRHSNDKLFITNKIKALIAKRDKAYKSGKSELYKSLRNQVSIEIKKAKSSFYDEKIRPKQSASPKSWWKKIKKIIGKKKDVVSLLDPETGFDLDDKQSATLINNFFVSLTKDFPPIKSEWFDLPCPENLPSVSTEDVRIELTKLNINKSPGPNDPFMKILKMFANSFAAPLAEIYNESFRYKYFPEIWKQYRVAPIPKVVPCTVVENTRPIALTSVLSKIQESFAVKWINEDIHGKISDSQFGGVRGSSTVFALLNLIHKWYKAMDIPQRVIRVIFLDFRKAFDLIDQNILLENMRTIGIRQSLIKWFATYLKNRSHFTTVGKDESEYQYVNGGVPRE